VRWGVIYKGHIWWGILLYKKYYKEMYSGGIPNHSPHPFLRLGYTPYGHFTNLKLITMCTVVLTRQEYIDELANLKVEYQFSKI
jgi:hypothetical protein